MRIGKRPSKILKHLPGKDLAMIEVAFSAMAESPFSGDIKKLNGADDVWRRRIGNYRILYKMFPILRVVVVFRLERRSSNTY